MNRSILMLLVAATMTLLVVFAGSAFSGDAAPAAAGTATCARFVDNNHDGICDSSAVCHKDGKCQGGCKNCPNFKDANNDGKCDVTVCSKHTPGAATGQAGAPCPSMKNGTCKTTGKRCPGSR